MKQNIEEQIITSAFNLGRIIRKHISDINTFDLTIQQIETLLYLYTNPQPTMAEIAKQLQISKPTATIHLDRLVELGLVIRINQPHDRRLVIINLTSKGKKLLKIKLKARKFMTKKILNCFSQEEKEKILATFTNLIKKLDQ